MNAQKKAPLVTVVIPVFNAGKYLEECLLSIMNQSYKNLEILVIDDGSTDDSLGIANRLADFDNRVRVVSQNNAGPGEARNCGLRLAHGEYVQFVDADDLLVRDAVSTAVQQALALNVDIVCFDFITFDCDGEHNRAALEDFPAVEISDSRQCLLQMYTNHLGYFSWAFLFRMDSIRLEWMHYPSKYAMLEDMLMLNTLLRHDLTVGYCHKTLYKYRIVHTSLSHVTSYKRARDAFAVIQDVVNMARDDGTLEIFVPNAVRLLVYADSLLPLSISKQSRKLHSDIKGAVRKLLKISKLSKYDNKTKLKVILMFTNLFRVAVFIRKAL